jgi:hypothetical protein
VSRSWSRPAPVRSGLAVEVEEAEALALVTPCVIAGTALAARTVWREEVEVAVAAVMMVRRVQVEVAEAAGTRCRVEGEVAASGSSRSG